jgi:hypothetical protein
MSELQEALRCKKVAGSEDMSIHLYKYEDYSFLGYETVYKDHNHHINCREDLKFLSPDVRSLNALSNNYRFCYNQI